MIIIIKELYENLQEQHSEKLAKSFDRKVGLKLDPKMVLHDDSGPVEYRLAITVFRKGGMENGHFYVAAPASHTTYVVYNNQCTSAAMTLPQLRQAHGKHVHGCMYVRTHAPAKDDWRQLTATAKADTAVRYSAGCFLALHQ